MNDCPDIRVFILPILIAFSSGVLIGAVSAFSSQCHLQWYKRKRKAERQAAKQRSLVATEIVFRDDFADWLEDEALRLQIKCATHPGEHGWADALAAVEASIAENADRIVALHQHNDETPVKSNGLEAVKQQWEALRVQGTSLKTEVS